MLQNCKVINVDGLEEICRFFLALVFFVIISSLHCAPEYNEGEKLSSKRSSSGLHGIIVSAALKGLKMAGKFPSRSTPEFVRSPIPLSGMRIQKRNVRVGSATNNISLLRHRKLFLEITLNPLGCIIIHCVNICRVLEINPRNRERADVYCSIIYIINELDFCAPRYNEYRSSISAIARGVFDIEIPSFFCCLRRFD